MGESSAVTGGGFIFYGVLCKSYENSPLFVDYKNILRYNIIGVLCVIRIVNMHKFTAINFTLKSETFR